MDVNFQKGDPRMMDYTPAADVAAGEVVVVGDIPAISHLSGGFTYDSTRPTRMMALAVGGGVYKCVADAEIAAGTLVYWNASTNKVTETRTGHKTFGFTLAASSADGDEIAVLHHPLGAVDVEAAAAVVAALTDNSGGAAADSTIGVITAPTAITDNSGGAAANGTIGAVTAAAAITDSSGGVDPGDNTVASITNANNAGSADVVPTAAAIAQLAAKANTTRTAIVALTDAIPELTARQAENRTAIVALTDAVAELAAKTNAILSALKTADLMASA